MGEILFALFLTLSAQAQEDCSCVPRYKGPTLDVRWTAVYQEESATPEQRKYFEEQIQKAADRWNAQFERLKLEVRVKRDDENPTVKMTLDPNRTELPYNHFFYMLFGPDYLQPEPLGTQRVIADIQHEFGHSLGFDDAVYCTGSIMSQVTLYTPVTDLDFSDCDIQMMFDANFGGMLLGHEH